MRGVHRRSSLRFCWPALVSCLLSCILSACASDDARPDEAPQLAPEPAAPGPAPIESAPTPPAIDERLPGRADYTLPSLGEVPHLRYHLEPWLEERTTRGSAPRSLSELRERFSPAQIALLEKLNRRDEKHLVRAKNFVVPERWDLSELSYSPLPQYYRSASRYDKLLVVYEPTQLFGAYENGNLVYWGPVSTGRAKARTPSGWFNLNFKSKGRASTVRSTWYLPWYFGFDTRRGLSFHQFDLPGAPASHACVRLLARDAKWLFDWGEQWALDKGDIRKVLAHGTPVYIVGRYNFKDPVPPWLSTERLGMPAELPEFDQPNAALR